MPVFMIDPSLNIEDFRLQIENYLAVLHNGNH